MTRRSRRLGLSVCLASTLTPASARSAEELVRIQGEPGSARLLLRHRPPIGPGVAPTVLIVHGATFPSAMAAAYPLAGRSWMDELAAHGVDAWALDFAGYGGSDRYPEMGQSAEVAAPLGRAHVAARQISLAVEEIGRRRGVARVSLIAHSWGTIPAGLFAGEHPERVDRLVLFGPVVPRTGGAPAPERMPAHHDMTLDEQWASFGEGVPAGEQRPLTRAGFDGWGAAYLATDPTSSERTPPSVRVPYGPVADALEAYAGRLAYDPGRITAPTLVIRGDWDVVSTEADSRRLLEGLGAVKEKSYVTIPRGTHRMHLEASRFEFFAAVESFLFGRRGPAGRLLSDPENQATKREAMKTMRFVELPYRTRDRTRSAPGQRAAPRTPGMPLGPPETRERARPAAPEEERRRPGRRQGAGSSAI